MKNIKMVVFGLFIFVLMIGMTLSVSYSFNKYGQTIELHFYTNGGNKLENTFYTYGKDKILDVLPVPEKEGYVFKGWFLDQTLETKLKHTPMPNFNDDTIVHLYAKWGVPEENNNSIFFHPLFVLIIIISILIIIVAKNIGKRINELKTIEEQ